jgi:hypothetical protein
MGSEAIPLDQFAAYTFARLIYKIFLLHKKVRFPLLIDPAHKMSDESDVVGPARL